MQEQTAIKYKKFLAIIALLLLVMLDSMGFGLVFPILSPLIMLPGGILPDQASLIYRDFIYALSSGAFSIAMFIAMPLIGELSDHLGRKRVMLFCLFGTALATVICAAAIFLQSISLFILGRILGGLTAGSQAVAQAALVDYSTPETKTHNFGWMALAGGVGFAIGPIVGGAFTNTAWVSWFGYWTPFAVNGLLVLFTAGLLYLTYSEPRPTTKPIAATKLFRLSSLAKSSHLLREALSIPEIKLLGFVLFFYEIAWTLYFQFIPLFLLQHFQFSSAQIGAFMSYIALILSLTFILIIHVLLRFFTEQKIAFYALWICVFTAVLPFFLRGILLQYVIVVPFCVAVALVWNAMLTLFSDSVIPERQGWIMGIANAISSVAWIFGSILTGSLDYFKVDLPFLVTGFLMLISVLVLMKFQKLSQLQTEKNPTSSVSKHDPLP